MQKSEFKKKFSIAFVDCTADDTGRYQLEASNACGSAKLGFGVNVVSKYLQSQYFLEARGKGGYIIQLLLGILFKMQGSRTSLSVNA